LSKEIIKIYVSDNSLRDLRKKVEFPDDFIVIDILKTIKDLGYYGEELSPESEFIITSLIEKKIAQGIYNKKSNNILIIHREMESHFLENLEGFLVSICDTFEYEIIVY
jgi:hypothetical protein